MCGITGFVDLDAPDRAGLLERMVATIAHRGPDDRGQFLDDRAGIGMTRLSIIDLAGGHQPKSAAGGQVQVVFNGEIYNYKALQTELADLGHRFESQSDTEVIARAFEAWGERSFGRLDGMFAIAVWDRRDRRLFLARDRLGKKPLYVWHHGRSLAFASELKALAPAGVLDTIDHTAFAEYLHLGYVPHPRSIWQSVAKLDAGHFAVFAGGSLRVERFWELPELDGVGDNGGDPVEGLRRRLSDAVRRRLLAADVDVGVLLSGGIDSSLVAWMASEHHPAIHSFSVGFEDPDLDESDAARTVATALGTTHHEGFVTAKEALGAVEDLPTVYDEPFADASAIPTLFVSRMAREHVKVVLSGDGGDELFDGYERYRKFARLLRIARLVPPQAQRVAPRLARSKLTFPSRAGNVLSTLDRSPGSTYRNVVGILTPALVEEVLGARPDLSEISASFDAAFTAGTARGPRLADLAYYLPDDILVKVDRASMSTGLEVRAPFLDTELVDWAVALAPSALGERGEKRVPRALLATRLGPEITQRRKQGFSVPMARWLLGPLRPLLDECLSPPALRAHGLVRPQGVAELVRRLEGGRRAMETPLWGLLMFQLWYDRWGPSHD